MKKYEIIKNGRGKSSFFYIYLGFDEINQKHKVRTFPRKTRKQVNKEFSNYDFYSYFKKTNNFFDPKQDGDNQFVLLKKTETSGFYQFLRDFKIKEESNFSGSIIHAQLFTKEEALNIINNNPFLNLKLKNLNKGIDQYYNNIRINPSLKKLEYS